VIRVLLAEDQLLVLDALAILLGREPDIEVVATARDGAEAVRLAAELRPDVALLDVEMPGLDGIEATRAIKSVSPATTVAILTTFDRPGYLERSLDAGATGFLLKDEPVEALARHIRRLHAGERVVDPTLAVHALIAGRCPLSAREREVLAAAADGASVAEIARRLGLSEGTVRNYLSLAIQKLGVANRAQAVQKARALGWV
jgi:two-component system response regulator DesR